MRIDRQLDDTLQAIVIEIPVGECTLKRRKRIAVGTLIICNRYCDLGRHDHKDRCICIRKGNIVVVIVRRTAVIGIFARTDGSRIWRQGDVEIIALHQAVYFVMRAKLRLKRAVRRILVRNLIPRKRHFDFALGDLICVRAILKRHGIVMRAVAPLRARDVVEPDIRLARRRRCE